MLPDSAVDEWFPVSLPVRGMFAPYLSQVGGVHAPHKMMLLPMEMLDVSDKPGLLLFNEGSGR